MVGLGVGVRLLAGVASGAVGVAVAVVAAVAVVVAAAVTVAVAVSVENIVSRGISSSVLISMYTPPRSPWEERQWWRCATSVDG